jgi:CarD family transcriptional regulator
VIFKMKHLFIEKHGIGQVIKETDDMLTVKLVVNDNTLLLRKGQINYRGLITKEDVFKIRALLRETVDFDSSLTWNRRYRAYMEKIGSVSIEDNISVYKELSKLRQDKDLSFGERKMLDVAKGLLTTEFNLVYPELVKEL